MHMGHLALCPPGKLNILLVEPHPVVSQGIEQLLKVYPQFELVGSIQNSLHAMTYYRKFRPNVIIFEPQTPGLPAIDLIRQLKRRCTALKFILYTTLSATLDMQALFHLELQAVVLKTQPLKNLVDALHASATEKIYLDPILNPMDWAKGMQKQMAVGLPKLSPRERQVLKLIAEGLKNREISASFSISIKTVETHRLNLMRKLDAHHVVDLVNWARRLHLVAV